MNDLFNAQKAYTVTGFSDFWQSYPRKTAKPVAQKAYAKALKTVTHDDIMFGLSQQLPGMDAKKQAGDAAFIPHPSTWLNQQRWEDDPEFTGPNNPASGGNGSSGKPHATTLAISFAGSARRTPDKACF